MNYLNVRYQYLITMVIEVLGFDIVVNIFFKYILCLIILKIH